MVRNLRNLSRHTYDVLVVGGGIYGVCVAWDAALRGLSVALVEKNDFGHATSSNSLRVIHGGLRYLQHGDIRRMRVSMRERTAFMRIAPHLVHPLPILIPAYGYAMRGKGILSFALWLNRLVGWDQKQLPDPEKHLPKNRVVSKQECQRLFPGVEIKELKGGAIVHDCQMSNSERLVLCFARSAAQAGAEIANYVEAVALMMERRRVRGVRARDLLTQNEFCIQARTVVNACGPWIGHLLDEVDGQQWPRQKVLLSKGFNLLTNRQLVSQHAVGIYGATSFKDGDAILDKGSRLYFILPWHDRALIGTAHLPYDGNPDDCRVTECEIDNFIREINQAYPAGNLKSRDIVCAYGGLVPAAGHRGGDVQLVRHHRIYDHQREDGVEGLISLSGVKFTEARYVAEKAVDEIFRKLGQRPSHSMTAVTPLYGGRIERLNDFMRSETQKRSQELSREIAGLLLRQYGSAYSDVLKYLQRVPHEPPIGEVSKLIKAETLYAIREEMAQKLTDVVFRRTTVGLPGHLTEASFETCLAVMASELRWNEQRVQRETEELRRARFSVMPRTEATA
jgi:glycerol-3-phosphate dehydrogenase